MFLSVFFENISVHNKLLELGEEVKDRLESMGNDLGIDSFSENDINEEFDLSELGY